MSSAAEGYGGGGGQEQLLHHYHHQTYHVPQHSRREKLRFPPEESPPPTSFFFHHDPNSLTTFLPSSSSSSSSYYSSNPSYPFSPTTQFSGHQSFSLSLASSSSSSKPPSTSLPQHQFAAGPAPRPAGPLGPFTGYAAVLNRSRFLEPAQQLLEEICDVGRRQGLSGGHGGMLLDADPLELSSLDHHGMEGLPGGEVEDSGISGAEHLWKKTRLLSMLDEVRRKYKQYYQQVQAVITSFESVAGLSTAAPYASMALKAMLKHFRCLKNKISNQLSCTNKVLGPEGLSREEGSSFGLTNCGAGLQRAPNNSGTFGQAHVWRPQRGLPERAVSVLRAWLFEHFLHPYPTDTDKQMLAKQTGLTRNQVSNWFINARVRLWKPMVEEIHSLEMRRPHKAPAADRNHNTEERTQPSSEYIAPSSGSQPLHSSSSSLKNQNPSTELFREDFTHISSHFVYDDLSCHQHGMGVATGAKGDVSLTLGLHQNNGVCLAEPLPMNVVRRFGLEDCGDAYVMSAFEGQDRHFGKDAWRAFPS
ncbi:BEL1-like homeodomain protein 9 [Cocos nucifera]|uniref:BEL1-like homeodomain protein 9 n=1 Tax=Cocos nucifera TaxID=13894 RepID=A0A8K0I5F7_COCNU|nr:BEL1-like homeodomain protein 9 [Cocos nucifera]